VLILLHKKRSTMKSVEPAFDFPGEFCPAGPGVSETDIRALEDTIARPLELNLRLTEILDLYNTQARQTNALQAAREEIDRLERTVFDLEAAMAQHGTAAAANQEEIKRLKKDKASLPTQRALALLETESITDRMHAMQATLDAGEANAASAHTQIDNLNSALAAAMAEQFKLVATVHGEKRRHNQKTSFWEDKIKSVEAKTAHQEMRVGHLEEVRLKLNTRIQVLEALRESERQAAERKIIASNVTAANLHGRSL
jgi:chromosome segregation ATPase